MPLLIKQKFKHYFTLNNFTMETMLIQLTNQKALGLLHELEELKKC